MLEILQRLALAAGTSYTGAAREAIRWYLTVAEDYPDPPQLAPVTIPSRTSWRGPPARWDAQVTLVLDEDLAHSLEDFAERRGISIANATREAISYYLTERAVAHNPDFPNRRAAGSDESR